MHLISMPVKVNPTSLTGQSGDLSFLRRLIIREIPGLAQLVERRTVEGIHGMEYRRNPQVSGSNPEAGTFSFFFGNIQFL